MICSYILASYVLTLSGIFWGREVHAHLEFVSVLMGVFAPLVAPILAWQFTIDGAWDQKALVLLAALLVLWGIALLILRPWFGLPPIRTMLRRAG